MLKLDTLLPWPFAWFDKNELQWSKITQIDHGASKKTIYSGHGSELSLILIIPEERTLKKQLWKTASCWSFKHLFHLWLSFFLDLSAAVRTPLSKTVKFSSRSNFMANVGPSGTVMTVTLNTGTATSVKIWSFKPARMIIPCRALGWNIPTMFMK